MVYGWIELTMDQNTKKKRHLANWKRIRCSWPCRAINGRNICRISRHDLLLNPFRTSLVWSLVLDFRYLAISRLVWFLSWIVADSWLSSSLSVLENQLEITLFVGEHLNDCPVNLQGSDVTAREKDKSKRRCLWEKGECSKRTIFACLQLFCSPNTLPSHFNVMPLPNLPTDLQQLSTAYVAMQFFFYRVGICPAMKSVKPIFHIL